MRESLHIINQCINNIPSGLISSNDKKYVKPTRHELKTSMEATIQHFKYFSENVTIKNSKNYTSIEAPKGEFGVHLISDNTNKPFRCKFRAPGFFHLQGIDFMSKDHLLADIVTIIGTQDIVFGEVDR